MFKRRFSIQFATFDLKRGRVLGLKCLLLDIVSANALADLTYVLLGEMSNE
jgi:hypothetical protein